jgi:hypothetical protein
MLPQLLARWRGGGRETGAPMKLFEDYVAHALAFANLAAQQSDPEIRAQYEQQAAAYRELAVERAEKHGLPSLQPQASKEP